MPYSVPQNIDPNKIFLVNFSELEGRLDPIYYASNFLHRFTQSHSVKLKDVCVSFSSGFGAGKDEQTDEKNGYIQIRPTNIDNNGELVFDKNVFVPLQKTVGFVEKRTVLFNNTNSQELVGKTAILLEERELYTSNHITSIVVDETKANAEYIWIILNVYQRNKIFFSLCTNWNNQSGIGLDLLQSLKIPVPPLHIQQQIVNVYNAALSQRKKKLSESKAKLASIDQYLLGELGITLPEDSHEKTFIVNYKDVDGGRLDPNFYRLEYSSLVSNLRESDFCKVKDVVVFSDEMWNQESLFSDYFPYLEISGINLEYGQIEAITLTRKKDAPSRAKMILRKGDLIVSLTRPMRGAIAIFDIADYDVVIASTGFSVIRDVDSKRISKDYLCIVLKSSIVLKQFAQRCSGGNYPAITQYDLGCVSIPLPSLDKQQEIADHISAIRAEAKALEQEADAILEQAKKKVEEMILG